MRLCGRYREYSPEASKLQVSARAAEHAKDDPEEDQKESQDEPSTDGDTVDVASDKFEPARTGCNENAGRGDVEIVIHSGKHPQHLKVDVQADCGDTTLPPPPPPPPPEPSPLDEEEERSKRCPCLDTWSYESKLYSGCVATKDWPQPWCATEKCGQCGESKVSSGCWISCGTFASPAPPPSPALSPTPAPPPPPMPPPAADDGFAEDSLRLCLVDNQWRTPDETEAMSADDLRSFAIVELSKLGRCSVTSGSGQESCHELSNAQLAKMCEQPKEEQDGFAEDSLRLCLVDKKWLTSAQTRVMSADDLRSFAIVELAKSGRCGVTVEKGKPTCHDLSDAGLARLCEDPLPEQEQAGAAEGGKGNDDKLWKEEKEGWTFWHWWKNYGPGRELNATAQV